jgi:hypothetical protein
VSNGLFTTLIDFGTAFDGSSNWLEIAVLPSGNGSFTTLTPRQQITPMPYAITSENLAGAITVQNNTNDAPNIVGGSSVNFVSPGVVGATISGGGATNYFGDSATNSVTADFGTVGGGFNNVAGGETATVPGGNNNIANGRDSTVGGGARHEATSDQATVAGGFLIVPLAIGRV